MKINRFSAALISMLFLNSCSLGETEMSILRILIIPIMLAYTRYE
jgi:hypothetical protein